MEESEKLDFIQRRTREDAKMRETGSKQLNMFAESQIRSEKKAVITEIKPYWLQKLPASGAWFGVEELADMMEETGWFESELQAAFHELEKEGKAKNIDSAGKRRTRFIHFTENGGRGERLVGDKK